MIEKSVLIKKAVLRYVIPFVYEESFQDIFSKIENEQLADGKNISTRNKWVRYTFGKLAEDKNSDLYDYIYNETLFGDSSVGLEETKLGCQWFHAYSQDVGGNGVLKFQYISDCKNNQVLGNLDRKKFDIKNMGLVLYRNKCGFIWYEIEINDKLKFTLEELQVFQANIKNLNIGRNGYWWTLPSLCETDEAVYGIIEESYIRKTNETIRKYIKPFFFGEWIVNEFKGLNIKYIKEKPADVVSKETDSSNKNIKKLNRMLENFNKFEQITVKTVTFPQDDKPYENKDEIKVPDRPILFSYIVLDTSKTIASDELVNMSYQITNGYTANNHFNELNIKTMRFPFKEVVWNATKEGVSYIAVPDEKNMESFISNVYLKFKCDYFKLFVKVLHQSLSLMLYSKRISNGFVVADGNFLKSDITALFVEINMFLAKSLENSVSHINHQSDFYIYLKEKFRIQEDIQSVTAGLESLSSMQRDQIQKETDENEKKRDNEIQAGVGLFAVLGIGSAFLDTFDFIAKYNEQGDWSTLDPMIWWIEVIVLSVLAIFALIAVFYTYMAMKPVLVQWRLRINEKLNRK